MRYHYNSRGQMRGFSMSWGENYVYQVLQTLWLVLVAGVLLICAAVVLAIVALSVVLGCLWWTMGWLVSRRPAWAQTGSQMRSGSAVLFPNYWKRRREERARIAHEAWLAGPAPTLDVPSRFTQDWIVKNVPRLHPGQIPTLLAEMRRRGWTEDGIQVRVMPYVPEYESPRAPESLRAQPPPTQATGRDQAQQTPARLASATSATNWDPTFARTVKLGYGEAEPSEASPRDS